MDLSWTQLRRAAGPALLLAALAAATGCSSFHRDWNAAVRVASAPPPAGVEGPWEGRWHSDASGHSGRLRCLLQPGGATGHQARFHAVYARVLTFGYTVPMEIRLEGGQATLHGTANLGALAGGIYTYDGRVTATNFHSTYTSSADHGTFELVRPAAPKARR